MKLSPLILLFVVLGILAPIPVMGTDASHKPAVQPNAPTAIFPATPWGYFKPAWEQSGINSEISGLMTDPQGRLEPEFRIPPAMRKRVLFWTLVYGHYDSRMRIVHDRRDPGILYGVIDFSPLYATSLSAVARTKKEKQIQSAIIEELKRRLLATMSNVELATVTDRERDQWRHFLGSIGVHNVASLKALAARIRTQTGQRDMFESGLKRASAWLPQMEEIFKAKGLPIALTRIPFVESSFNPSAQSKKGAFGIWQFTRRTAQSYLADRSRDEFAQTEAAARWLKRFRTAYPDWGATVTAYNSGTGRVSRLLSSHDDTVELIEDCTKLGFAGRNFYSEVLAANLVESYKTWFFARDLFEPLDVPLYSIARSKESLPTPAVADLTTI